MRRWLMVSLISLSTAGTLAADFRRHGVYCPLPRQTVYQVPVVETFIERLVPAAAVAFQYLGPTSSFADTSAGGFSQANFAGASSAPPPLYAAELFDEGTMPVQGMLAQGMPGVAPLFTGSASIVQQRCAGCHHQQARGGVRLLDGSGQLNPARNGQPLAAGDVLSVVWSGRMPPSGPLTSAEKELLTRELLK